MSWWSWLFRPRPPSPPPTCGVAVVVKAGTNSGATILGADVTVHWPGAFLHGRTNRDGYVAFSGVPRSKSGAVVPVFIVVIRDDYVSYPEEPDLGRYEFYEQNQNVPIALQRECALRRPSMDVHRGNFCNLRDRHGRVMFDPYLAALSAEDRADWYDRHRQAGSTHLVLSPSCAYNPEPWPGANFNWIDQPARFAALVREVLATPAADGLGFMPVIILDSGDPGFRQRMDRSWRPIREALGADAADCRVVPGWELIKASSVTSKEYSDALHYLRALDWPHIWAHLSVERAACSSHPVEVDDPWQGAESACWKSHGGEFVEGLLYQATAFNGSDDWLNRWDDVVPRLCQGMNGWRIMHLCLFETVAYGFYRGDVTSDGARDVATKGRDWARDKFGVTGIGYGNGLPW